MSAFPTLTTAQVDSSQFSIEYEDPAQRTEIEGGYVISRPKHTRLPRRTFKVMYRMMKTADREALQTFYNLVRGGSEAFTWVNPQDSVTYTVRFKEPLVFSYVGRGTIQRWDCGLILEQA